MKVAEYAALTLLINKFAIRSAFPFKTWKILLLKGYIRQMNENIIEYRSYEMQNYEACMDGCQVNP